MMLEGLTQTRQTEIEDRVEEALFMYFVEFAVHLFPSSPNFKMVFFSQPVIEFWKRKYFAPFLRVKSQFKNSERIPYIPFHVSFQGAFPFPTENKVKSSCSGRFPVLVSQRPLSFTSQKSRAVSLVGLNLGKMSLKSNLECIY